MSVAGFVAAYQIDLIVQLFDLAFAAQVFNGGQQMLFLAFGDEFRGADTLSQKPQFFKVVGTTKNFSCGSKNFSCFKSCHVDYNRKCSRCVPRIASPIAYSG